MEDGKVWNAEAGTKSKNRCYISGAISKDFNKILDIQNEIKTEAVKFGFLIIHARIRFFESILYLTYKSNIGRGRYREIYREEDRSRENIELKKNTKSGKDFAK